VSTLVDDTLVIGLGGNLGGEEAIIARFGRAREAFSQLGETRSASLYRSAPIGLPQPMFLNSALRIRYAGATPSELISTVLELEHLLGRERENEQRGGPRTIDLDVLAWGPRIIDTPELAIPHPRLLERRFALMPIADLFGEDLVLPTTQASVGALLAQLREQKVDQLAASW
jgi:2-amino-4-hydroxy-6-hydroxymethyldihydropteridine diphosphokinase